jgi:hypothetical protein
LNVRSGIPDLQVLDVRGFNAVVIVEQVVMQPQGSYTKVPELAAPLLAYHPTRSLSYHSELPVLVVGRLVAFLLVVTPTLRNALRVFRAEGPLSIL